MSRLFYQVMQDNVGNLLFDVSGTMRLAGTGTLATIYGDEGLTVILPNPMTNHPSFGSFKCFLGAGDYDFYMAKAGYTFETLTGVQGHGTMAQQDANNVAITGGSALGLNQLTTIPGSFTTLDSPTLLLDAALHSIGMGTAPQAAIKLSVSGGMRVLDSVGIRGLPLANTRLAVEFVQGDFGAAFLPSGLGALTWVPVRFQNYAGTDVGAIVTTDNATAYNTTSDARLKEAVTDLRDALAVVQQLRPVAFRWKGDGSPGHGFLAEEAQTVVPEAVTGVAQAVDEAGQIVPQGMDMSKLVVWVVGAVQELAARLTALEAARA